MNYRRLPALIFKKKNIIILNNRNIRIIRLNKSLNYKNLECFKVIKFINNIVYKLNLSKGINIYLIFYL